MKKLIELITRCEASVNLTINEHKDMNVDIKKYFENYVNPENVEHISDEVMAEMIAKNTLIELIFYPHSPIGFYVVYHYDLEMALDEALKCLD